MIDQLKYNSEIAKKHGLEVAIQLAEYIDRINTQNKPDCLYHGSPDSDIAMFEPRADAIRRTEEGTVVFGTHSKAEASTYLVASSEDHPEYPIMRGKVHLEDSDSSTVTEGKFVEAVHYLAVKNFNTYRDAAKQGGTIYEMPVESFKLDSEFDTGSFEHVSHEAVAPTKKEQHEDPIVSMMEYGVQIFLLSDEEFKEMQSLQGSQRIDFLKSKQSYNQTHGINPIQIP